MNIHDFQIFTKFRCIKNNLVINEGSNPSGQILDRTLVMNDEIHRIS